MISRAQLALCQEKRIKRQQTVSSDGCKVLARNTGFLLASMPSYCRFRPIQCFYFQSVSVSVPLDNFRGSALQLPRGVRQSFHLEVNQWALPLPRRSLRERCFNEAYSIADLQKMAVAEWLQSYNSVRGPMKRLEIM